ncbi:hypothetical protein C8J57DRAFT_1317000 [Mycena rebaudengoi]|nr:hypothetical protein C8J57DRAFT_1317000 [Mycena rebaudengoi]
MDVDEGNGKEGNDVEKSGSLPRLNLHKPPQWLLDELPEGKAETRFIFRHWPRDPNGKGIEGCPRGKEAPNGLPFWGATLYDFYTFSRYPEMPNFVTTTTGSRLAKKMREIGELDAAAPEIAWADNEEEPKQLVMPEVIGKDIKSWEGWAASGLVGRSARSAEALPEMVPLEEPEANQHCDISSILAANYPAPWPLVPFSCLKPSVPKLETLIPFTLLPKKLIVHDPWNLLSMTGPSKENKDWTEMPDITHVYELKPLTKAGLLKDEHQQDVFCHGIDDSDFILLPDQHLVSEGPCPPLLNIKVPAYPRKSVTPAAHLYISPAHKAGIGNHSVVYNAEWELPRSLLIQDVFCHDCVEEEVKAMTASGELTKLIQDAVAAGGGDVDDVSKAANISQTLKVIPESVVDVSKLAAERPKKDESDSTIKPDFRIVNPRTIQCTHAYHGPIIDIHTKVKWQSPGCATNCEHVRKQNMFPMMSKSDSRPPTATVRVCAKLSKRYDNHLEREAKVYQALPSHLSEHWSGYNIIPPSRNPVPVGAVVPQFYGYYTPVVQDEKKYRSAIMLLEDCGKPLETAKLSPDDKKECWSLLYRLHEAEWVHESVAERNIMMQPGPMTTPQGWMRSVPGLTAVSFRVIDFGRSLYCGEPAPKDEEADDVLRELRAPGQGNYCNEKIRRERGTVDSLLSQDYM